MSNPITQATESFKAVRQSIPKHKARSQWVRTLAGAVVFAAGFAVPTYLHWPWQAGLGIAAFGAFIASQQLVRDFIAAVGQFVLALMGKGGRDDG